MRSFSALTFFFSKAGWFCGACLYFVPILTSGQETVTAQVEITRRAEDVKTAPAHSPINAGVVVWLRPVDHSKKPSDAPANPNHKPQLVQKNKSFEPHLLVVEVGTVVDFPNHDPFFHNVFSLFEGKRFDLGLYEAGATNSVRFDKAGISFLFCNIHPEMSAVVVAVDSPYFGISDRSGRVTIAKVPDGRYEMHAWYERSSAANLKLLTKMVSISPLDRTPESIRVVENPDFTLSHKNKYGQEYVPPPSPTYSHR